ncbi:hypothetical protein PFISCL1PPCAC_16706, partial [Pristionchus fissidentatus]
MIPMLPLLWPFVATLASVIYLLVACHSTQKSRSSQTESHAISNGLDPPSHSRRLVSVSKENINNDVREKTIEDEKKAEARRS